MFVIRKWRTQFFHRKLSIFFVHSPWPHTHRGENCATKMSVEKKIHNNHANSSHCGKYLERIFLRYSVCGKCRSCNISPIFNSEISRIFLLVKCKSVSLDFYPSLSRINVATLVSLCYHPFWNSPPKRPALSTSLVTPLQCTSCNILIIFSPCSRPRSISRIWPSLDWS